jgi:hypothetical protein
MLKYNIMEAALGWTPEYDSWRGNLASIYHLQKVNLR